MGDHLISDYWLNISWGEDSNILSIHMDSGKSKERTKWREEASFCISLSCVCMGWCQDFISKAMNFHNIIFSNHILNGYIYIFFRFSIFSISYMSNWILFTILWISIIKKEILLWHRCQWISRGSFPHWNCKSKLFATPPKYNKFLQKAIPSSRNCMISVILVSHWTMINNNPGFVLYFMNLSSFPVLESYKSLSV